jgi:hypothetical protein
MKTLVIDALIGAGFHSVVIAQECERVGLADFDKYHSKWSWRREQLEQLDLDKLQELYTAMRESREELEAVAEPEEEKSLIVVN